MIDGTDPKRAGELTELLVEVVSLLSRRTRSLEEAAGIVASAAASLCVNVATGKPMPVIQVFMLEKVAMTLACSARGEGVGGTAEEMLAVARGMKGEGPAA